MKSGVKGILVGMAMLTMYGVYARVENIERAETQSYDTLETSTGFAMGTGVLEVGNGFAMGTGERPDEAKMSTDMNLQVQTNLPEDVCNSECKINIYNILNQYSEELNDTTIIITDGENGSFTRDGNDIYISMNIDEETLEALIG